MDFNKVPVQIRQSYGSYYGTNTSGMLVNLFCSCDNFFQVKQGTEKGPDKTPLTSKIECPNCGNNKWLKLSPMGYTSGKSFSLRFITELPKIVTESDKVKITAPGGRIFVNLEDGSRNSASEQFEFILDSAGREVYFASGGKKSSAGNFPSLLKDDFSTISKEKVVDSIDVRELIEQYNKMSPEWDIDPKKVSGKSFKSILSILRSVIKYPAMSLLLQEDVEKLPHFDMLLQSPDHFKDTGKVNLEGTNPADILKLTKNQYRDIMDSTPNKHNYNSPVWESYQYLIKLFGNDMARNIFNRYKNTVPFSYYSSTLNSLIDKFGTEKVYKWIMAHNGDVELLNRNIRSMVDYLRMAQQVATFRNEEFEPKLLKPNAVVRAHNEINRIYNELRTDIEFAQRNEKAKEFEEAFNNVVQKNLKYEKEYGQWKFELPKSYKEFINESGALSHCLGNGTHYFESMAKGADLIVLVRYNGQPQITIEIIDNRIAQAKGYSDRSANEEEQKIISKWANEMGLNYNPRFAFVIKRLVRRSSMDGRTGGVTLKRLVRMASIEEALKKVLEIKKTADGFNFATRNHNMWELAKRKDYRSAINVAKELDVDFKNLYAMFTELFSIKAFQELVEQGVLPPMFNHVQIDHFFELVVTQYANNAFMSDKIDGPLLPGKVEEIKLPDTIKSFLPSTKNIEGLEETTNRLFQQGVKMMIEFLVAFLTKASRTNINKQLPPP